MAHEVTPWKQGGCSLSIAVAAVTTRERHSQEISERYGEGGGLNADYRTVEAVAIVANALGMAGWVYGEHFVFKTGDDEIVFDFRDEEIKELAAILFSRSRRWLS